MFRRWMRSSFVIAAVLVAVGGFVSGVAYAQVYIFANGGLAWEQSGTEWHYADDEGYCNSSRGPCSSDLWYLQWSYNHYGCGFDEYAFWDWPSEYELGYDGRAYAWIDGDYATMYGADYWIGYDNYYSRRLSIDQSRYVDAWVFLDEQFRPDYVHLTDGWSYEWTCQGDDGLMVEFDEVKLEY